MHSFEVYSNERTCIKSGRLGLEKVTGEIKGYRNLSNNKQVCNFQLQIGCIYIEKI